MADFTAALKPACQSDGAVTLAKERAQSTVPVQDLAKHLLSRDDFLNRQERILKVLQREPLLSKTNQMNLSRPDRYQLGLARAKLLRRLTLKHSWDHEDYKVSALALSAVPGNNLGRAPDERVSRRRCLSVPSTYDYVRYYGSGAGK